MSDAPDTQIRAKAQLLLRERKQREALASAYDWYGDECECGKALGECRTHLRARPNQRPPGSYRASNPRDDWRIWMLRPGRAFGKSLSAAQFITHEVQKGQIKWVALVSETVKDVRDVMIEHPSSGLLAVAPPWFKPIYEPSKAKVTWPNGTYATIYSAETPEALRGPEFGIAWCDELAKWRFNQEAVWDNLEMCLRAKTDPRTRVVVTTTPRPTATFRSIRDDKRAVVINGALFDNFSNLDEDFVARMKQKYEGTRLGRQELYGEDLDDTPGALWNASTLDANRVKELPPGVELVRIVVAIDPAVGSSDPDDEGAETGIIVGGKGTDGHAYILEDCTIKGTPDQWAQRAVAAYFRWKADLIVGEKNNGGEMIEAVIRHKSPNVSYKAVWASRGKVTRAEPIASLDEQHRIHHVGYFPELENQLTSWVQGLPSPDRLDARTWCVHELMETTESDSSLEVAAPRRSLSYSF